MEARGCKILGLFTNDHGGRSDEAVLLTAYASHAHWKATRGDGVPAGASEALRGLPNRSAEAIRERHAITRYTSTRVLRQATNWVDYGVREA